jgi:hypothetical protein
MPRRLPLELFRVSPWASVAVGHHLIDDGDMGRRLGCG